jgi:hypothetical protein
MWALRHSCTPVGSLYLKEDALEGGELFFRASQNEARSEIIEHFHQERLSGIG